MCAFPTHCSKPTRFWTLGCRCKGLRTSIVNHQRNLYIEVVLDDTTAVVDAEGEER